MKKNTNISIQILAISVGLVLMAIKFGAWWLTHSNAILTDALESIVNILAGCFALYSLFLSAKPKDRNHPYGHGKIEFISATFEGLLVLLAGLGMIIKAVYNFIYPTGIHSLDIGILLVAITGIANYALGFVLEKRGNKASSMTLIASGQHLKSDAYSSVGLILGLGLVLTTGWVVLDNVVAVIFGALIVWTGYQLLRTSVAGIMDEADPQLIADIVTALDQKRTDNWVDLHNFRVIKYGTTLHIDCHMTLPWYFDVRQAHDEVEQFEITVNHICTLPTELFIHSDPCQPHSCKVCLKEDCPVRQFEHLQRVTWTLENIVKNQKHDIDNDSILPLN